MKHLLVDVFFPASAGAPTAVAARAAARHLDAVVYVADTPDELPEDEDLAQAAAAAGVSLWPGCVLYGPGFRALVIVPDWDEANFDVLESLSDLTLMAEAVTEMGGVVLPVSPHTDVEGEVNRSPAPWPDTVRAGVISLLAHGKLLARDLDIEEAARAGRPSLGASGPLATLDDLGRFATFLPVEDPGLEGLIASLTAGRGVAVESVERRPTRDKGKAGSRPEAEGTGRRRRRPRRGRRKGGEAEHAGEGGKDKPRR